MKKWLAVLMFLPSLASAANANLDFHKVSLVDFSEAIFKGFLKKDYIITNDVLDDTRKITVSLNQQSPGEVLQVVKTVLTNQGISLSEKAGVYYLEKIQPQPVNNAGSSDSSRTLEPDRDNEQRRSEEIPANLGITDKPATGDVAASNVSQVIGNYKEVAIYKPKYRPSLYLSKLVKFLGGKVADNSETDAILYSATNTAQLDKIQQQLERFDTKPQAVTIRAALIEFSETTDNALAFNFSSVVSVISKKLNVAYGVTKPLQNQASFSGLGIDAVISATHGDSRFSYLANPVIRVLDGEKAKLLVGSEVPTRGQSTIDRNGNIVQSYIYQTSGVQIEVQPMIKSDFIALKVNQQLSSFVLTTTSAIDSPTLNKRQAETVLDVKRGELVVLAGIDEDKDTKVNSGLQFLPKFLQDKSNSKSKSQILLLIEVLPELEPV